MGLLNLSPERRWFGSGPLAPEPYRLYPASYGGGRYTNVFGYICGGLTYLLHQANHLFFIFRIEPLGITEHVLSNSIIGFFYVFGKSGNLQSTVKKYWDMPPEEFQEKYLNRLKNPALNSTKN